MDQNKYWSSKCFGIAWDKHLCWNWVFSNHSTFWKTITTTVRIRRTHFPYFINSKPTVGIQRMAWTLLTFYSSRSRRFCWVIVQFYALSLQLLVLKPFPHPTEKVFPYGATHQLYKWALGTCPNFFQCRLNRLVK